MRVKVYDVSLWSRETHAHTSGTRDKSILTNNKGEKFYFKKSLKRENRYYEYEFWSEVIASLVGTHLGFNTVKYNIAHYDNEIGCISQSIIGTNQEKELIEGYGFIIEKFPDFTNNYKKTHSYQKIIHSLRNKQIDYLTEDLINLIIFDSIIGNSDRHSENWAIIASNKKLQEIVNNIDSLSWFKKLQINIFLLFRNDLTISKARSHLIKKIYTLSPFYDNGSSLARELNNEQIEDLLYYADKFERYINKGRPDIRWENKHVNHFTLVDKIRSQHAKEVDEILKRIENNYNPNTVKGFVQNVDSRIPTKFANYIIPQTRKDFICKYIDTRIKKLLQQKS